VLADAGYWHNNQIEQLLADGFQVLVPPDSMVREGARPGWEGGMYDFMRRVLKTDFGDTRNQSGNWRLWVLGCSIPLVLRDRLDRPVSVRAVDRDRERPTRSRRRAAGGSR
jgi:hypothetical protein